MIIFEDSTLTDQAFSLLADALASPVFDRLVSPGAGFEQRNADILFLLARDILKDMSYDQYLCTEHWRLTRLAALDRAGHRCQLCNTDAATLQVHHRTYERRGHEDPGDLVVLCRECHARFHGVLP